MLPPCSGFIPRRDRAGRRVSLGWSASGSAFDLRVLTRFQMSRRNDCPPPPPGRGDNTSEPARIAAISLLYGALIATNHAAHSRELQKQRAGPATPCAKSPEPGFLHTHVPVCGYTQGSLTRFFFFCPVTPSRQRQVVFGRPLGAHSGGCEVGCSGVGPSGPSPWALGASGVPPPLC